MIEDITRSRKGDFFFGGGNCCAGPYGVVQGCDVPADEISAPVKVIASGQLSQRPWRQRSGRSLGDKRRREAVTCVNTETAPNCTTRRPGLPGPGEDRHGSNRLDDRFDPLCRGGGCPPVHQDILQFCARVLNQRFQFYRQTQSIEGCRMGAPATRFCSPGFLSAFEPISRLPLRAAFVRIPRG